MTTLHVSVSDDCGSPPDEYETTLRAFLLDHDLDDEEVYALLDGVTTVMVDSGGARLTVRRAE